MLKGLIIALGLASLAAVVRRALGFGRSPLRIQGLQRKGVGARPNSYAKTYLSDPVDAVRRAPAAKHSNLGPAAPRPQLPMRQKTKGTK